jgi:hypothetical protein
MKKKIMTTIAKFAAAGLLLFTIATAQAQSSTNVSPIKNIIVRYVRTEDDDILFNVTVDNPNGNKFCIIVTDNEGSQLYKKVCHDKQFDSRFRLPESETGKLSFIVRNFKDASDDVHSFDVSDDVVEEVQK